MGGIEMFGNRLKELRENNGLTKAILWQFMGFECKNSGQLLKWENNKAMPDCYNLVKLADIFRVSTDYLLGRTDIKEQR